jgi:hypothetical protein
MGQQVECKRCFFSFSGGHNHHSGASIAICLHCLSRYQMPTECEWGPFIGERIPLLLIGTAERLIPMPGPRRWCHAKLTWYNPPVPTDSSFVARAGEQLTFQDQVSTLVHYPVEEIPCPQCGMTRLTCGFHDGDRCPQCHEGLLDIEGVIY